MGHVCVQYPPDWSELLTDHRPPALPLPYREAMEASDLLSCLVDEKTVVAVHRREQQDPVTDMEYVSVHSGRNREQINRALLK